jgi:hypothetical protein
LGDSFVEGLNNDNDAINIRPAAPARRSLRRAELWRFRRIHDRRRARALRGLRRHFDPRIVVLFFVNYNDLQNLQSEQKRLVDPGADFLRPPPRFEDVVAHIRKKAPRAAEKPLRTGSCLHHLYRIAERGVRLRMQGIFNLRWDFRSELERVYLPDEDPDIARAWQIVEAALRRLQDLVREEGATLVVVDIADPYQLDPNWLRLSSVRTGKSLDATRPNKRLGDICRRSGILFYDQYGAAKSYIDQHGLQFPYLSFSCDRHYTREGQELLGRSVVRFLHENDLVEP